MRYERWEMFDHDDGRCGMGDEIHMKDERWTMEDKRYKISDKR